MILTNRGLIPQLRKRVSDQLTFINNELEGIPSDSLSFHPGKGSWSAVECIEHLNMVFDHYLPRIRSELEKPGLKLKESYSTGFFGDRMVSSMEPRKGEILYSMKTFRKMKPELSRREKKEVIVQFKEYMKELDQLIVQAETIDLGSIKIKSAIGIILRFKLGDCYRFLLAHNQRHLLQCQNVLKVLATHQ